MFKLASLRLGLLATLLLVPSSQAATFQDRPPLTRINGTMFVQKLVPIRKSSKLKTRVMLKTPVAVPRSRKVELAPADRESQRKVDWQREMNDSSSIGANERAVGLSGRGSNATDWSNQPDPLQLAECGIHELPLCLPYLMAIQAQCRKFL
jgi:hypothetical protein